nr:nonribosomal peptide synthetase 1 [Quercus suber]
MKSTAEIRKSVDFDTIRSVLSDVLCLPRHAVHREASFLDLGGDSVTALEFRARCSTTNVEVQIGDILECSSLGILAAKMVHRTQSRTDHSVKAWSLALGLDRESAEREVQEQLKPQAAKSKILDMYPATALQQALMTLAVKQPGSYISEYRFALANTVDIARFQAAWGQLLQACAILRTRIVLVDGQFWQIVLDEDAQWKSSWMKDTSSNQIDFGSKLCHYALQSAGTNHYFHLRMHHAVFDGWSLGLISQTLAQYYDEGTQAEKKLVPFSNFVEYSLNVDTLESRDYWKDQLNDAKRTVFPSMRQGDPSAHRSTTHRHHVGLSVRPKSTTIATAPVDGIEHIAGPVISTVPVRIKLDQQQPVAQFLQSVQSQAAEMIAFEQLGLQNIAALSSDAKEACRFSTLLAIQLDRIWSRVNNSLMTLHDSALVSYYSGDSQYYDYPLVVQVHLLEHELVLYVTHDDCVLSKSQVERITVQYEHVVRQLLSADAQDDALSSVTLCGPYDIEQILQWNADQQPLTRVDACVHDLISETACRLPQNEAIFA